MGFRFGDFYRDTSPSGVVVDTRKPHLPRTDAELNAALNTQRFDELEQTADAARPLLKTGPVKAFARNAVAHAFDTAALPVTLAGAGLEALGYPNRAAHLDANEALEDAEWLCQRRKPDDYRFYVSEERAQNPTATALDAAGGDTVGAPASRGVTERGIGAAVSMAKKGAGKVAKAIKSAPAVPSVYKSWDMPKVFADAPPPVLSAEEALRARQVEDARRYLETHPDVDVLHDYIGADYAGMNELAAPRRRAPRKDLARRRWGNQPRRGASASSEG
ncbi:MAG: hypothetical protein ACOY0T_30015 [Myxococcota bacterium]